MKEETTEHPNDERFVAALRTFTDEADAIDSARDAATIDAAFARFDAGEGDASGDGTRWRRWAVIGTVAAAAVAAIALVPRETTDVEPRVAAAPAVEHSASPVDTAPQPETGVDAEPATVRSGALRVDGEQRVLGLRAALPQGVTLVAHSADTCVDIVAGEVCFDPDARFELERPDRELAKIRLHRGRAIASSPPEGEGRVRIATEHADVETSAGRVSVDVGDAQPLVVIAVLVGEASYSTADGTTKALVAGDSVELGAAEPVADDGAAKPLVSAAELLERAQAQRAAGKIRQAAGTFAQLAKAYPRSRPGRTAMVTLGDLELQRGRPAAALRWLDRYLKSGTGVLAQEAGYLRIRALRELGRTNDERASIEAYLRRYPDGTYTSRLKKRLAQLGG